MLSLATARELKTAGLTWTPAPLDYFAIPDRGLDEHVFVISDIPAHIADMQGRSMVTFQGAVEWALDHIATGEAVWLPRESQLREMLAQHLAGEPQPALRLATVPGVCRCELRFRGAAVAVEASNGSEAYAAALLHVLRSA